MEEIFNISIPLESEGIYIKIGFWANPPQARKKSPLHNKFRCPLYAEVCKGSRQSFLIQKGFMERRPETYSAKASSAMLTHRGERENCHSLHRKIQLDNLEMWWKFFTYFQEVSDVMTIKPISQLISVPDWRNAEFLMPPSCCWVLSLIKVIKGPCTAKPLGNHGTDFS